MLDPGQWPDPLCLRYLYLSKVLKAVPPLEDGCEEQSASGRPGTWASPRRGSCAHAGHDDLDRISTALSCGSTASFGPHRIPKEKEKVRGHGQDGCSSIWRRILVKKVPSPPLTPPSTSGNQSVGTLSAWPSEPRKDGCLEWVNGVPSLWCPPQLSWSGLAPKPRALVSSACRRWR